MIEANEIFSDSDKRIALWCNEVGDTNDLALLADNVIENKIPLISVPTNNLAFLWTCLENSGVKIFTRHFFETTNRNLDEDVSDFSCQVISDCKNGANGVQVFLKMRDFERFADLLATVRDDLFFEHDLSLVLNIQEINANDWPLVFDKLRQIHADYFGILFNEDMGNRSDFIGRIYGMLENWNFDGGLHFMLENNFDRIDQVVRLVESMRSDLNDKIHFFLEY
jgi:hypothetical protein